MCGIYFVKEIAISLQTGRTCSVKALFLHGHLVGKEKNYRQFSYKQRHIVFVTAFLLINTSKYHRQVCYPNTGPCVEFSFSSESCFGYIR